MVSTRCVRTPGVVGLAVLMAGMAGCGGQIEDGVLDGEEGETEVVQSAVLTSNALSLNALSLNALSLNALSLNALALNALSLNALSLNALALNALKDPQARDLLKYVVSCALDEDQGFSLQIDRKRHAFPGSLGLAPEWARGRCDGECQRWVSACVLARVSHTGKPQSISLRGEHRALHPEPGEVRDYRDREATYYGNIFARERDKPMYMCLSPGKTGNERVCGRSLKNCDPIEVVGSCDRACDGEGRHKAFTDCSASGKANRGHVYHESITVFLPK